MRPFHSTISLDDALAILHQAAAPVARMERIAIGEAAGRVAAADVVAAFDVPPFDRAAMDGYAVRATDTAAASWDRPSRLRAVGTAFTGEVSASRVEPGTCVTIATGAPLPVGADAVVMVEQTSVEADGTVLVRAPATPGQHIGRRGADMTTGQKVLLAGAALTPARVGVLAALGRRDIDVYARPRVYLASTGNEVVDPGARLLPGQIYDINRFTLAPIVAAHGGEPRVGPPVEDTLDALRRTLDEARDAGTDLIVLSGGSSVGDRDLLVDAVRERGQVLFHGIAVKPGKPTLLATIGGRLVLGMPGNPTSCLSNAYILLVPLLRRLARLPPWRPERRVVRLARDVGNPSGRYMFYAVRLEGDEALPAFKGSGDITSLADADGYIGIPAEVTHLAAGAEVIVTMF